jgi:hypothetical protein
MSGGSVLELISKAICFAAAMMILSISGVAVSVVVNEMELNPPEGGTDWVEIYNPGNESVDISGWTVTITDNSWVGKFPSVSTGTIIPAQGFYVFNGQPSWNHEFGGYATLTMASGEIADKTATRKDSLGNDFTYGRHPDGYDTNTDGDWGLGSATKGKSNVR